MNKRLSKVVCISASLVMSFAAIIGTDALSKNTAKAENDKTDFSSEITAFSNAHGETVNILPDEVRLWNESKRFDADYLNGLYEYSDLHKEFLKVLNDNERVVEIYSEADAFKPVNNVLRWKSSLENVESYKVRVAYDNKFTKCVLTVDDADIDKGVTLESPLTGTTYYWQVIATLDGGDKVYSPIFDFTTESTLRTVAIDGVSNTRDIGGYETEYGYVKQGLVYRSARLESITAEGIAVLKEKLGVKTDLDLRGEVEVSQSINKRNPANLERYFVYDTPQYATYITGDWGADSLNPGVIGINGENHYQSVRNIMTVFTDVSNYPIDFHCAVGRDRTGTIAAVLKAVLGFGEQDIINDYFTSMFATTGAWNKDTTYANKESILNLLIYLKTFSGETLADKTADYLITKCGMTQEQIDAIRSIMTGREGYEVDIPAYNTFADVDNYSDCCFVTFEKFGVKKVTKVVLIGEAVEAPFYAGDGFVWTVDGNAYDFAAAVNEDLSVVAVKAKTYEIKIVSTGDLVEEERVIIVEDGKPFDVSALEKVGYNFTVVSDEGRTISGFKVTGNATLNVIYTRV